MESLLSSNGTSAVFLDYMNKEKIIPNDPKDYETSMNAEQKADLERAIKINSIVYISLILSVKSDPGFGWVDRQKQRSNQMSLGRV